MSPAHTPTAGTFDVAAPSSSRPDVRGVDAPAWPAGFPHPTSIRRSPRASSVGGAPARRVAPRVLGGGHTLVPSDELLDELLNEPSMETSSSASALEACAAPETSAAPEPLAHRYLPSRGFGTIVPPDELLDTELGRLVSALPEPLSTGASHVTYEEDDIAWFDHDSTVPPAEDRGATAERPFLMLDGDFTEELPSYLLHQKDDSMWIAFTAALIATIVVGAGAIAGTAFLFLSA